MRALVCGGRDYRDREQAYRYLDQLHAKYKFTEIIAGAAAGADTYACMWAESRGVAWREFPANWDHYGDKAGRIRNLRMLEEKPDLIVAFPGGAGTRHMITSGWKAGVPVISTWREEWQE